MTVVGTLTHELGHYSVAKYFGCEAKINYQSCRHWKPLIDAYLSTTYEKYYNEIDNNLEYPEKNKYELTLKIQANEVFWILLGGPVQTMLTGSIGLLLLLIFRKNLITNDSVKCGAWLLIFTSLFWLRQVPNLASALRRFAINPMASISGDEMRLAEMLHINIWVIQIVTGLLGLAVLYLVVRLLPKAYVFTFLISGLLGGTLGFYLWLVKFGKYVMP
jgi:FtsH-binding integral membrane protein